MVSDGYSLSHGKARICRIAGAVFIVCAGVAMLGAVVSGVFPGARAKCGETGCPWTLRPSLMLDEDVMGAVQATPAAERRFDAYALRPAVRAGVAGIALIEAAPFAILLVGVGLALRRLGGGGRDALARALPWLRRASQAALAWAIARPVADSLRDSLLSAGTPEGAHWQIPIDLIAIGTALMLGIAAYATVWALEAGLKAQRELDDFV